MTVAERKSYEAFERLLAQGAGNRTNQPFNNGLQPAAAALSDRRG